MRTWPGLECLVAAGLLVLCALSCLGIARATAELEAANARRRAQLRLLGQLIADPTTVPPGPIALLDGLYRRPLAVVPTAFGPALAFMDAGAGRPSAEVAR